MSDTILHSTDPSTIATEQNRPEPGMGNKASMGSNCSTSSTIADALDATPASTKPSSSRLLALPTEIRREILRLALPFSCANKYRDGEFYWHLGSTAVLRSCHQLHVEGTSIMYSLNPLNLSILVGKLALFIKYITPGMVKTIGQDGLEQHEHKVAADEQFGLSKRIPPTELGKANITFMQHWSVDIHAFDSPKNQLPTYVRALQARVAEAAMKYLCQARRLRKVTVRWTRHCVPGNSLLCHEDMATILESLTDLGVPIEEFFDEVPFDTT